MERILTLNIVVLLDRMRNRKKRKEEKKETTKKRMRMKRRLLTRRMLLLLRKKKMLKRMKMLKKTRKTIKGQQIFLEGRLRKLLKKPLSWKNWQVNNRSQLRNS
jgi:hypothetical protein